MNLSTLSASSRTTRTRRLVAGAAAVVLAGALAPAVAGTASAGTATSGPLSITINDTKTLYDCNDYTLNFSINLPEGNHWNLDTTIKGASGAEVTSTFDYGYGSASGNAAPQICASDAPGRYSVEAVLTVDDIDYEYETKHTARTSFTLSSSPTSTTIKLKKKTIKQGGSVTLSGKVTAGSGPYAGRPATTEAVMIQAKTKRKWKTVTTEYTGNDGRYKAKLSYVRSKTKKISYRAVFAADSPLAGSTSKTVKLKLKAKKK